MRLLRPARLKTPGIVCLVFTLVLQLAAIAILLAVALSAGKPKQFVKPNYLVLIDSSNLQVANRLNGTIARGLPDSHDRNRFKDFFAIYLNNYCSGLKTKDGKFLIDFCSKPGKQTFDQADNWVSWGFDIVNIPTTTYTIPVATTASVIRTTSTAATTTASAPSPSLATGTSASRTAPATPSVTNVKVKRKGGGGKGGGGGGGGKGGGKGGGSIKGRPATAVGHIYSVAGWSYRMWLACLVVMALALFFAIVAIWIVLFHLLSILLSFAITWVALDLALTVAKLYKRFPSYASTLKGVNGTYWTAKSGSLIPGLLYAVMAMMLLSFLFQYGVIANIPSPNEAPKYRGPIPKSIDSTVDADLEKGGKKAPSPDDPGFVAVIRRRTTDFVQNQSAKFNPMTTIQAGQASAKPA